MNQTIDTRAAAGATSPRRKRRTKVLLGIAATLAIAGTVVAIDFAVADTDHANTTFHDQITAVDVDVSDGSVRIVGSDEPDVAVDVALHGGLRKPQHSETVEDGTLRVRSDCHYDVVMPTCSTDYVVHVPSDVVVVARGNGTDYDLVSLSGEIDISLNGGHAHLEFSSAPDRVKAHSNGGNIVVRMPDGAEAYRVEADSSGGSTRIDIRTDPDADRLIDAHSNGGDIVVEYGD